MAEMAKSLLSEYYGFGTDGRFEKSLSSHDAATNTLEISSNEIEVSNQKKDEKEADEINKDNSQEGDENNIGKKCENERNSLNEQRERSRRVLSEESLLRDDNSFGENYKIFLETNSVMNDYVFKNEKTGSVQHEESTVNTDNSLRPVVADELSDANLSIVEESASEIRSNLSSAMPKKRSTRKLKTSVMPLPPPPKKVPICNGVYLDLTSTGISEFPLDVLDKFSNLRMLYLENNNLSELPNELFPSLKFLQWLDVRNNQLVNLPSNVAGHPSLETILLQGNKIERLPLELCQVPKLKGLQTMRNPLVFPPKDIVSRGCTAILEYLREEWQRLHPEEILTNKGFNEHESEQEVKPDLTTILCYKPKSMLKKKKKIAGNIRQISSMTSTSSSSDVNMDGKTVRQKSWDYKPSNRCRSEGENFTTAARLMWIAEVKEMLGRQALALQRMKDKEALKDWRQDKSSFDKSIEKASNRTAEDIPFAIDLDNINMISKQDLKMKSRKSKSGKRGIIPPTNINQKMEELLESLSQLQLLRISESLSPRTEQKLLEVEIKKISDLQDEVHSLKRYNDAMVAPLMERHKVPCKLIQRPPSFII